MSETMEKTYAHKKGEKKEAIVSTAKGADFFYAKWVVSTVCEGNALNKILESMKMEFRNIAQRGDFFWA